MILAKLKEATRQQHEALESVVDVMNSTFTLDDYKKLLTKFYSFYSALEPTLPLDALKANGFDAESRLKLRTLERDLTQLGILDAAKADKFTGIPAIDSTAKAFGSCYVMEGATLGGQIIGRHLSQTLGIGPDSGAAFFSSYGANVGPMWKEFGAAITEYAAKAELDDEIVEGTRATFDSFRICFANGNDRDGIRTQDGESTHPAAAAGIS